MGSAASKAGVSEEELERRLEAALGPPSKTMDASEYAQGLVMMVAKTIESHLGILPVPGKRVHFKATQMITRAVPLGAAGIGESKDGTVYYVKVETHLEDWPWVFVKIYDPPHVTSMARATFKGMKKMKEDYKLVTF